MRTLTLLFTLLLLTISIPTLLFLGFISFSFHWTSLLMFTVAGAIAFGLVLAVGASLNARFRRSLDDFTAGRTTDLTPSKALLRVFGLLLVTLLPRVPVAILLGLAVAQSL